MAFFESESPAPPDMEKAIRMLERGQELMMQLRCLLLLQLPEQECLPDLCRVLLDDISGSMGLSLSALRSSSSPEQPWRRELRDEAADQRTSKSLFPEDNLIKSNKGCSPRKRKSELMGKLGEDDHKKRKRVYSSTTMTAAPYDDGYLWRKYGQKVIRGAKYPRSYFRCTYSELDCPATKQVQQNDSDDPPMFVTIYTHKHTCNSGQTAPHVIVESTPAQRFSLSFVSSGTAPTPRRPQHPSPTELGHQQESRDETWTTRSGAADLFSESELITLTEPMAQFLMNTPEAAEAPSAAPPCSPTQIWEIEGLVDSLLGN